MLKKIAISGPECTGKSSLAKELSVHYNTVFTPEYSVQYLKKKRSYNLSDVLEIAKGQLLLENELAVSANRILFSDTDLMVNKIWSKVVFDEVPEWIERMILENHYDLYLLCTPDLPWKPAPFRENPFDREMLFELYEEEFRKAKFNYKVISGLGNNRIKNAINFVDEIL